MKLGFLLLFFAFSQILIGQNSELETPLLFSVKAHDTASARESVSRYIAENIEYPGEALDKQQSGEVWIQFTIDTLGNVINDSLLFENYPSLIQASRDFFYETSGMWTPATKNGQKVNSKLTLPFKFSLIIDGKSSEVEFFEYGLGKFEKEKFEEATLMFKYALRNDPYHPNYLYNTAVSYLKRYMIDSACFYLSRIDNDTEASDLYYKFCLTEEERLELDESELPIESMPLFNGAKTNQESQDMLYKYIFSETEKANVKEWGTLYVRFVVDSLGNAVQPEVLKTNNLNLNSIAIRIIENLPQWEPGTRNGKPVKVQFTIPIRFD